MWTSSVSAEAMEGTGFCESSGEGEREERGGQRNGLEIRSTLWGHTLSDLLPQTGPPPEV